MKIDVAPRSFFEMRIGQDDVLRILDAHKIISIQSSSGYDSLPPFSPDALLSKNLLCLVFDDYSASQMIQGNWNASLFSHLKWQTESCGLLTMGRCH